MRKWAFLTGILLAVLAAAGGFWRIRPDLTLNTATGTLAHDLCSETFVAGLDPQQTYQESLATRKGIWLLTPVIRWSVDRNISSVTASLGGLFPSRAIFRDGLGCVLVHGNEVIASVPPALMADIRGTPDPAAPIIAGPAIVETINARLKAALDAAFAEFPKPPLRATKAIVILHDGKIVAESYAPGYGVETPILGFSLTKSVTNALIGILVRQGKLRLDQAALFPEWRGADDPRRTITIEQLMRMDSGLNLNETGSGFDPANRMFYTETDMAGFSIKAGLRYPVGTHWAYSSSSTQLLARVIRDQVGGTPEAVLRFAWSELFRPLGMEHVTIEFDATGTPIGGHYMFASPRDWARFGLLYMNDGMVGNRRILPQSWTEFSASPTLDSAYGAGFFTRRGSNKAAPGMMNDQVPADTFAGFGNLGQRLAIVPSAKLVLVRMGRAQNAANDFEALDVLLADSVKAVAP